jgi:hypothetical protein
MPLKTEGGPAYSVWGRNVIMRENLDIYYAGKFVLVLNYINTTS